MIVERWAGACSRRKKRIYADKAAGVPPPYKGRLNGIVSETICSGIMSFVCGLAVASLALYALHCLGAFDKISQWKNNRKSKNMNHFVIKFQFIEQKNNPDRFSKSIGDYDLFSARQIHIRKQTPL